MVRWTSQSKSVKLPEGKVSVNYIYTNPTGLSDIKAVISDSLEAFGEWGSKGMNIWFCRNSEEYDDAHERLPRKLFTFIPEFEKSANYSSYVKMFYINKDTQRYTGLSETHEPNFFINNRNFSKFSQKIRKPVFLHEFSHKKQADLGYNVSLLEAFSDALDRNVFMQPWFEKVSFLVHKSLDDMSANEIAIEKGFGEQIFDLSKYMLELDLSSMKESGPENERMIFADILQSSRNTMPFIKHSNGTYASKLRSLIDEHFSGYEFGDPISMRQKIEKIYGNAGNPPDVSSLSRVYDEIRDEFIRLS